MLDPFDYKEPACVLCDGKDFYYRSEDTPLGRIPVARIISKLDGLFAKKDLDGARQLLLNWQREAEELRDADGELSIQNELVGFFRKTGEKENALHSVERASALVDMLSQGETVSGATVILNCATTLKAFGYAEKALPLYEKAESVYNALLDGNDERFGGLCNNKALALVDLERFDDAEASYQKAVSVMKKIENGKTDLAVTYVNMAHMYECLLRDDLVSEYMQKAYSLLKSEELPHDGYYAFVCEKCAPAFEYFGYNEICEELTKASEDIYEGN